MTDKGTHDETYEIHGNGLETLGDGFDALGLARNRREEALRLVTSVFEADDGRCFRWYKTAGTNELSCYWDGKNQNVLWITNTEVHVLADEAIVRRPDRTTTWQKEAGKYIGWLLPGAVAGEGGARPKAEVATTLCPETFLHIPAGSECPDCLVIH